MKDYVLKIDEDGEYCIDLSQSPMTTKLVGKEIVYLYGAPIIQLGEYEEAFGSEKGQILFNIIRDLLCTFNCEELIKMLQDPDKLAENLDEKTQGEQNMAIDYKKKQNILGQMLMAYKKGANNTMTAQPAAGVEVQEVYDKLMLLEEQQIHRDIVPIPVHIGDIAYVVTPMDISNKRFVVDVVEILDADYKINNNKWKVLVRIFGKAESWWSELGTDTFLDVKDAITEQTRRIEEGQKEGESGFDFSKLKQV